MPPHPLNHVTTGECVEALVLSILTGEHALYNVSDILYSAMISKAIIKHSLGLSHLHFDTTRLSLYGEYDTTNGKD
ncbi:MAG: hypothetical protein ACNA7I_04110 [Candidatus Methanoperedens sp.]|nr:hypothetical protein [Candidatus Methanoperedens sp.]